MFGESGVQRSLVLPTSLDGARTAPLSKNGYDDDDDDADDDDDDDDDDVLNHCIFSFVGMPRCTKHHFERILISSTKSKTGG